jgi:FMN reductase
MPTKMTCVVFLCKNSLPLLWFVASNRVSTLAIQSLHLASGPSLQLPLYQPENPHRTAEARALVAELAQADGIVIGSPGYHGSISGLVKNALDYAEDLRGDRRSYVSGRALGCIATAGGWPAAVKTLNALRDIVHALRGWPTPMAAAINSSEAVFDQGGACTAPRVAQVLDLMAEEILSFGAAPTAV